MKSLKYIALIAAVCCSAVATAQQNHCIGYLSTLPIDPSNNELTQRNWQQAITKTQQIIARNNAAKVHLYNQFAIYPTIEITDQQRTEDGMQKTSIVYGEFSLTSVNTADLSTYATAIVKVNGTGKNTQEAINKMIQNVSVTDPAFTKFIKNSSQKIVDYYNNNIGIVIKKVETLMAQEKYDDALNLLISIPECVPAYEQSAEAIKSLMEVIASKSCRATLTLAERLYMLGDIEGAKAELLKVKPGTECDAHAKELAEKIGAKPLN